MTLKTNSVLKQYGYELPEESIGQVYFNVVYPGGDRTVYTYPSCCVFQRGPQVNLPSDKSGRFTLCNFRQDLIQLLKNVFPSQQIEVNQMEDVLIKKEPVDDHRPAPRWKDKLLLDLDHDARFKMRSISSDDAAEQRISKYFPPPDGNISKTTKKTPAKNSKITNYFGSSRSMDGSKVAVKRTSNKIFFKVSSRDLKNY